MNQCNQNRLGGAFHHLKALMMMHHGSSSRSKHGALATKSKEAQTMPEVKNMHDDFHDGPTALPKELWKKT